jgi:demethylmenaquinone methyltransferase/2-methoxy-6-polyprenyl-1,4-benzoquinol methylase
LETKNSLRDESIKRAYFCSKAEIWDDKIAEKDLSKLEDMARHLEIKLGSTVLDVGTGTDVFVPFLLGRIGSSGMLVCLDYANAMLEKARAKNFKGNIAYVCADIVNAAFAGEVFDAVVCYSSFPHFQDKLKALKEIGRVLKKGGTLFICHTSSRASINEIHQQIALLSGDTIPDNCEMRNILIEAGFTDIRISEAADTYLVSARSSC